MTSKKTQICRDLLPEPKVTVPRWEENQDEDNCNPDKLLQCPYDPNHKIRACRLPYHLIKCRKNNPQLASELWTCPFNACHLMPKYELSEHMSSCMYRCSVNTDYVLVETAKTQLKFQVPVSTWTIPVCDEDWDQEQEDPAPSETPFVWGVPTTQLRQDSRIQLP
ncbi:gametocyte-specific factor 1 isoform X2 [Trichomycterus rosablanca]|uniref:gametocyte-specific factor 1 isoform X2 n=1 Tax=Trichomycterus rosablanca TaxID=2290929 RepID=UPI002F359D3D